MTGRLVFSFNLIPLNGMTSRQLSVCGTQTQTFQKKHQASKKAQTRRFLLKHYILKCEQS
jgi:hypothetical protein